MLDASVATVLHPFSPVHQREEALRAAQAQAVALPLLVDRLDTLMATIEQRSQQLDERMLASQARFQQDAAAAYTTLASSVGTALQDSLAAGARAAGDSIRPVMEASMAQIAQDQARHEAQRLQAWSQQLQGLADGLGTQGQQAVERMDKLAQQMATGAGDLVQATAGRMDALAQQTTTSVAAMAQQITASLEALAQKTATSTQALATPVPKRSNRCDQKPLAQNDARQPSAYVVMTAREHRVHGPHEIAQVVGRGNQPGGGQVDLPFAEQVRHLRGESKAANAHGHRQ
eukprot:gene43116-53515_t